MLARHPTGMKEPHCIGTKNCRFLYPLKFEQDITIHIEGARHTGWRPTTILADYNYLCICKQKGNYCQGNRRTK